MTWRISGAVATHPPRCPGVRFVSNGPQPAADPTTKDIPHPVSSSSARKHKVDLRPGPVKPPRASSDSSAPPATPLPTTSDAPTTSQPPTNASSTSSASSEPSSVIETAKEDYYDASQHGILAPPPENASWAGKLWHQAKELFKFYWNGVKLINTNRLRVRAIEARVKAGGAPLSRWETRFIANYKLDALKLIPFVMIIIIAEEAIPLVVIYAPFLLPSTCLLPSQKERIDKKRREKQMEFTQFYASAFSAVHGRAASERDLPVKSLLNRSVLIPYTGVLGLSTFGPSPMRLRRIKKRLAAVAKDDVLLAHESQGDRLTPNELRDALEERGIVSTDLSLEDMRARLQWWLAGATQTDSDPIRQRVMLVAANAIGKHT
ncbi:hypothetical protein C8Q80DRAFT_1272536 [Daedaleopsis nitida]|nr:hypothetical protein C8Q80DRAFT_1272536 [Daedaleopsis nitida]